MEVSKLKRVYWGAHATMGRVLRAIGDLPKPVVLRSKGRCCVCNRDSKFVARNSWLRDHYKCVHCGSIPRQRALMYCMEQLLPSWQDSMLHESSPGTGGASRRLRQECTRYTPSQYFPNVKPGKVIDGTRCENLECLTFADESIDVHVTQDVLEHVFDPAKVFSEIGRTLKPGGIHIFTVPLVRKFSPSQRRARLNGDGIVEHLKPAEYHGSPISEDGSLVTIDWGFDITKFIFHNSGLFTQIVRIEDPSLGIKGEFTEVLITSKPVTTNQEEMD